MGDPSATASAAAVEARRSPIVLGPRSRPGTGVAGGARGGAAEGDPAVERAADVVVAHCAALIAAAGPACVAVKPQVACFERLGAPGWRALERVADAARAAGLLVLADAKRGDIGVTAEAYAQAFLTGTDTPFGRAPGLDADALTVSPYLGEDTLTRSPQPTRRRGSSSSSARRTPARRTSRTQHARQTASRCGSSRADRRRASTPNAVVGATAPEHLAAGPRAHAARRPSSCPASAPRAAGRGPRARLRPRPARRPRHRVPLDRPRPRAARRRTGAGGARRRPSACARRHGRSAGNPLHTLTPR